MVAFMHTGTRLTAGYRYTTLGDATIAHVAKEIGVSATILGRWVKLERERRGASDGLSEADLRAENARLRRELAEAKMDNEFLSKATAFFAAKQREQKSSN